ncbi:MAG: hypothetical protein ACYSUI_20240, partial [Planctomycetota bacterium]
PLTADLRVSKSAFAPISSASPRRADAAMEARFRRLLTLPGHSAPTVEEPLQEFEAKKKASISDAFARGVWCRSDPGVGSCEFVK